MGKSKYITNLIEANKNNPAPFDSTQLKCLPDEIEKHHPFLVDKPENIEERYYKGDVDLNRLIGGDTYFGLFTDYCDRTWSSLLQKGMRRSEANLEYLKNNPEYYLSTEERKNTGFVELRGNFYIRSGWHRTLISKYFYHYNNLPMVIKNATIEKIEVDEPLLAFFNKFKRLVSAKYPELFVLAQYLCLDRENNKSGPAFYISIVRGDDEHELYEKGLKGIAITKNNIDLFRGPKNNESVIHP
jgi:hypothetical protein